VLSDIPRYEADVPQFSGKSHQRPRPVPQDGSRSPLHA